MAEIRVIGRMDHTIDHTLESANRVYDVDGIAPTIPTCSGGGTQPKVLDKQIVRMVGRNPDNPKSRIPGLPTKQRIEPKEDGICGCLTNVQKDNLVMETQINKIGQISNDGSQYGTVIGENGLSATLSAGTHGYANSCIQQKYRIRKLTVKECARLMNFDDADYEAMTESNYYSDSQGYKMCGNSIVVSCLVAIFSQLNIQGIKPWNDSTLEEKRKMAESKMLRDS